MLLKPMDDIRHCASVQPNSTSGLRLVSERLWNRRGSHVEIMATKDIPADLPPMMEFKKKADAIIFDKYGISVEHITAPHCYEDYFYYVCNGKKSRNRGKIYGFPLQKGNWCNSRLKVGVLEKVQKDSVTYIGIAVDEPVP